MEWPSLGAAARDADADGSSRPAATGAADELTGQASDLVRQPSAAAAAVAGTQYADGSADTRKLPTAAAIAAAPPPVKQPPPAKPKAMATLIKPTKKATALSVLKPKGLAAGNVQDKAAIANGVAHVRDQVNAADQAGSSKAVDALKAQESAAAAKAGTVQKPVQANGAAVANGVAVANGKVAKQDAKKASAADNKEAKAVGNKQTGKPAATAGTQQLTAVVPAANGEEGHADMGAAASVDAVVAAPNGTAVSSAISPPWPVAPVPPPAAAGRAAARAPPPGFGAAAATSTTPLTAPAPAGRAKKPPPGFESPLHQRPAPPGFESAVSTLVSASSVGEPIGNGTSAAAEGVNRSLVKSESLPAADRQIPQVSPPPAASSAAGGLTDTRLDSKLDSPLLGFNPHLQQQGLGGYGHTPGPLGGLDMQQALPAATAAAAGLDNRPRPPFQSARALFGPHGEVVSSNGNAYTPHGVVPGALPLITPPGSGAVGPAASQPPAASAVPAVLPMSARTHSRWAFAQSSAKQANGSSSNANGNGVNAAARPAAQATAAAAATAAGFGGFGFPPMAPGAGSQGGPDLNIFKTLFPNANVNVQVAPQMSSMFAPPHPQFTPYGGNLSGQVPVSAANGHVPAANGQPANPGVALLQQLQRRAQTDVHLSTMPSPPGFEWNGGYGGVPADPAIMMAKPHHHAMAAAHGMQQQAQWRAA